MNEETNREELLEVLRKTALPEMELPKEPEKAPIGPPEWEESHGYTFRSNRREIIAALVSYYVGWVYYDAFFEGDALWKVIFTALFCGGALLFYRENLRKKEHWIWLGCLWMCLLCDVLGRNQVWDGYMGLFIHGFAIYWILSLSGKLLAGESSAFLLADAFNGLILWPMKYLFTFFRARVLLWGLRKLRPGEKKKISGLGYIIFAVVLAALLFILASRMLISADANFGSFLRDLWPDINMSRITRHLPRFIFISLPVGAYLYGLVVGTGREKQETLDTERDGILSTLEEFHKIPNKVWTILVGAFAVYYLLFFGLQGSYLFGAFARQLPEGFTVAEYARQGFFELCGIMGLNFCLLWIVWGSSRDHIRAVKGSKVMCTVLMGESILFAVTAMSKLLLYIDCFGFTPLRLQSFWGVTVLMAGCIFSIVSIWSGKKTAKYWICFTGITLALLHLY